MSLDSANFPFPLLTGVPSAVDAVNEAGIKANVAFSGAPMALPITFDGSKATRVLGLKYRDNKTIAIETAKNSIERWGNPQTM